jgi:hypothetical protein
MTTWAQQVERAWDAGRGGLVAVMIGKYHISDVRTVPAARLAKATQELSDRLDKMGAGRTLVPDQAEGVPAVDAAPVSEPGHGRRGAR